MKTPYRKRHGLWIDLLLVGTIAVLGSIVIYLTVLSDDPIFPYEDELIAEATLSNISEEPSIFPGVRIVTDISTTKKCPLPSNTH